MPSTNLQYEQFLSQTIAQLEESASAYSGERVQNMYAHMNGTTVMRTAVHGGNGSTVVFAA